MPIRLKLLSLVSLFVMCFAFTAQANNSPAPALKEFKDSSGLLVQQSVNKVAIAPNEETTVHILLRCIAPYRKVEKARDPVNIALVIDHSGSMGVEKKMDYAIAAATLLVRTLEKDDQLALIVYDDIVDTLHPLGPVKDKEKLINEIKQIYARGNTFISGGLEAGIMQLAGKEMKGSKRILLLSDGLANHGVTDAKGIAEIGAKAKSKGIVTSSMGLGVEYDETLMEQLAQRGGGMYYYIKDSEDLAGYFRQELSLAQKGFTKNLQVVLQPDSRVTSWKVFGYSTVQGGAGKPVTIEMGELYEGDERQVLLELTVKGDGSDAAQLLGNVDFSFNDASAANAPAHKLQVPVEVTIVADASARTEANKNIAPSAKVVEEEVALNKAEETHVAALEELNKGNIEKAKSMMADQAQKMAPMAAASPALANKMEALNQDVAQAEAAASDAVLRQSMTKSGKESKYLASQGKKDGSMLDSKSSGGRVERLQRLLQKSGYYKGPIDGKYSDEVTKSIKEFQKAKGLDQDGIAGQSTLKALNF